jgi:membrane-associated HD superfamily phosphohydrolase
LLIRRPWPYVIHHLHFMNMYLLYIAWYRPILFMYVGCINWYFRNKTLFLWLKRPYFHFTDTGVYYPLAHCFIITLLNVFDICNVFVFVYIYICQHVMLVKYWLLFYMFYKEIKLFVLVFVFVVRLKFTTKTRKSFQSGYDTQRLVNVWHWLLLAKIK